ncbi:MAG: hypothetical protein WC271_06945 [Bacteroidales bacterium]|nr:hypothetical protein [Bacteroidales bacterium]NLO52216.1 hypothetical protein [Bacteroidales bacterium]
MAALVGAMIVVLVINLVHAQWNNKNKVLRSDVNQYYSYLPALFIYHDIKLTFLEDDAFALGPHFYPYTTPLEIKGIVATYGVALLYLPFFLAGHAYALLFGYPATGFSAPYQILIQWSGWVYLLFGLLLMRRLLIKYFPDVVTAIVIAVTVVSTSLLWYVTGEAAMSHVYSFFTITAFLFLIDRWTQRPNLRDAILIGLTAGLIALIRPTNALVGMLLILWKVGTCQELKERFRLLLKKWPLVLTMIGMAIIMWLPQFYYWKIISGQWFFSSYPTSKFFWGNPQLFNVLFSWRKGWLIYTPVMAFTLIGIGLMYRVRQQFFWPLLVYFLASWYVISSWWSWWYGGGLSIRPFVDSYGIFAFGLAAFLTWAFRQRRWLVIALMIPFVFTLWNGAHNNARYFYQSISWDANSKRSYLDGFFHIGPQPGYWDSLEHPDYQAAKKGIYQLEGEGDDDVENNQE